MAIEAGNGEAGEHVAPPHNFECLLDIDLALSCTMSSSKGGRRLYRFRQSGSSNHRQISYYNATAALHRIRTLRGDVSTAVPDREASR